MVLGALVLREADANKLEARLQQCREKHHLDNMIKWGKVSRSRLAEYQMFIKVATDALHIETPAYYALVVDTSTLDHHHFNQGDREIAFSKFVYQLLMKCARLDCGTGAPLHCFLDDRTTRQTLDEVRQY